MFDKLLGRLGTSRPAPRRLLNVGGNSHEIPLPAHFEHWLRDLLDIDPASNAELVCDAREMTRLAPATYDAIYCSHNLEHYLHHDARRVLTGFLHVLKDDGFADIRVPDVALVMRHCVELDLDLDDTLFESPAGPIMVRDVLWGFGRQMERSGTDYYAHKTGFSRVSLTRFLEAAGFTEVFLDAGGAETFEVRAIAFKRGGANAHKAMLGIA